jgi:AI-2 transport protein TqsA
MSSMRTASTLPAIVGAAAVVVLAAGLKAASQIFLPIVFSVFLGILAWPLLAGLLRLRVPRWLAIPLVVLAVTGGLLGVASLLGTSLAAFTAELPRYQAALASTMAGLEQDLIEAGLPADFKLGSLLDPAQILEWAGRSLRGIVGALSNTLLVVFLLVFVLLEGGSIGRKLHVAIVDTAAIARLDGFAATIQSYLVLKTIVSAGTGLCIGLGLWLIGLDFPFLWGLVAFLLNFIPSVGSIVAGAPAILLALVQFGPGGALGVATLFLVVNLTIGNLIEPRVMGDELGLSPLVVLLSLLVWGWIWGPMGMLLAVPMTVIVKVLLELHDDTRWIAVLLGSAKSLDE